eukprot:COSAG05_NODE_22629_length_263_cov_0.939024_1_plen_26_part_10
MEVVARRVAPQTPAGTRTGTEVHVQV